jgi:eukaryotic-like serine/threonine-protein kinase
MKGYLRVESGPDQGRVFDILDRTSLTIGRSQKTDTQLKDFSVSRVHCEVRIEDGQVTLLDQEGSSGTFLNGKKIAEQVLKSGDTIRIGDTEIKVHLAGIADAETVTAAQKTPRTLKEAAAGLTGQFIENYEVGPVVAKGSTGTNYKARDIRDGKTVALKILHPNFVDDEDEVQRFIRAMHTAADLKHPNLVALLGAGKLGGLCWIAMEFFEGESLSKVMAKSAVAGMVDWTYAVRVAVQIARALEVAHQLQIVHRNISPGNILVTRTDPPVAKLGDLMLAKALHGLKAKAITRPGELVGDLIYMSPERTREDGQVDTRSDIYALGATLYLLLTGRPPFESGSLVATLTKIRQEDPVPAKKYQLSIPDPCQDLVLQMMAKRPESRPQSPAAVIKELDRIARFAGITI